MCDFSPSSPLYEVGFNQIRTRPMASLSCNAPDLNVKSLAKFFTCFGVIAYLSIELSPSQIPSDFRIDMYDEIPVYHARQVHIGSQYDVNDRVDSVFLAMMSACRSLRHLSIMCSLGSECFIEVTSLMTFVLMCKSKDIPLESILYLDHENLLQLRELMPELRIDLY
jgi:hypothetical protein